MKATRIKLLTKLNDGGLKIKSVELVDIINQFRKVESEASEKKYVELRHADSIAKIETEVKSLLSLGLEAERNFSLGSYLDKNNQSKKCYELNRDVMIQMLNSESALVRFKTVEYINQLEDTIKQVDRAVKTKGKLTESDWNKIQKKSIYLNE